MLIDLGAGDASTQKTLITPVVSALSLEPRIVGGSAVGMIPTKGGRSPGSVLAYSGPRNGELVLTLIRLIGGRAGLLFGRAVNATFPETDVRTRAVKWS